MDKNDCECTPFAHISAAHINRPNNMIPDTNEALHFYKPDNVATTNGVLNITTVLQTNKYKAFNEKTKRYYADAKHVQSGMVQGWNKFCMTGGIIEFSAKLPGDPKIGGLWPALWMLGNLARATYVGSSNFVWPYSYGGCDEHNRKSQKISACSKVGHYGMKPGVGRGSPEIDILEAMMGSPEALPHTNITRPYFSTSLQIAPGVEGVRPVLGKLPKKVSEEEQRCFTLVHDDVVSFNWNSPQSCNSFLMHFVTHSQRATGMRA